MMLALTIIHVVISLALVIVVLMQHGKQQGLSGAIAGGAETFFGKNKGRTVDAMLKKFTAVVAVLFIVSSIVLAAVAVNEYSQKNSADTQNTETSGDASASNVTVDENGNLVDENGNVLATADQMQEAQQSADATAEDANTDATADATGESTDAAAPAEDAAKTPAE